MTDVANDSWFSVESMNERYEELSTKTVADLDEDALDELRIILELRQEVISPTAMIVREDDLMEYAQDYAEDMLPRGMTLQTWPLTCVDWDKALDAFKQDMRQVECLGGYSFFITN